MNQDLIMDSGTIFVTAACIVGLPSINQQTSVYSKEIEVNS